MMPNPLTDQGWITSLLPLRPPTLVAAFALVSFACAVGTLGTGDGVPAVSDAGPDSPDSPDSPVAPSDSNVDSGSALLPSADAGKDKTADTGLAATQDASTKLGDSGSAKDGGSKTDAATTGCASPSKPAGCNGGCTAHLCSANGCYGGYLCDTTTLKCKAPGLCP